MHYKQPELEIDLKDCHSAHVLKWSSKDHLKPERSRVITVVQSISFGGRQIKQKEQPEKKKTKDGCENIFLTKDRRAYFKDKGFR